MVSVAVDLEECGGGVCGAVGGELEVVVVGVGVVAVFGAVACAVGAVLSALLPFETLGRDANAAEQLWGVSKSRPPPSERTPLTVH